MILSPIHPVEHLAEELAELKMGAAEFARELDVPTDCIAGVLNGRRAVTDDTAFRLGRFFGMSAEFWLSLQCLYNLRLRQPSEGDCAR